MNNKLLPILFIAIGLSLSGCSKFLEEKSQDEVIPKTAVDFKELLMGSGYFPNEEPNAFTYYMDDDVEFFIEYENGLLLGSSAAKISLPSYTWQPTFDDINGLGEYINDNPANVAYAKYYKWIMGCNAVLDNIDNAIGTQQEIDRVKGEALAVRALYYFRLVNLYGEPYNHNRSSLGVPLKLHSGMEEVSMERATVEKVYENIVADLKEASRLMDPLVITRKDFHINQPAIHILLSRVYLFMENWEGAIAEANKVFEKGGRLYNMTEGVIPINYLTYENPEIEWLFGGNPQANQSTYIPSREFLASFSADDMRARYGFSLVSGGYSLINKLHKPINVPSLIQTLRSSEAILTRAEAYAISNKLTEAMGDLNELRKNRISGYIDENITDKDALIAAIRDERRKEFCYEGFRWFDLRRYGMPSIMHRYQHEKGESIVYYKLEEKDPMYTLPFPNSLLLRNPGLVQNPSAKMGERHSQ